MLPRPIPPGWVTLQKMAKSAKDPEELCRIINQMNKLLDEYEERHGNNDQKSAASHAASRGGPRQTTGRCLSRGRLQQTA